MFALMTRTPVGPWMSSNPVFVSVPLFPTTIAPELPGLADTYRALIVNVRIDDAHPSRPLDVEQSGIRQCPTVPHHDRARTACTSRRNHPDRTRIRQAVCGVQRRVVIVVVLHNQLLVCRYVPAERRRFHHSKL